MIAELLNAGGLRISGGLWRDKFSKRYSGIPKVGIDENNSFRVNGELFFPIGPFMTSTSEFDKFINQAASICCIQKDITRRTHLTTWSDYLDKANAAGLDGYRTGTRRLSYSFALHPPIDGSSTTIPTGWPSMFRLNKDKPAMFAWIWQDEPNMGGRAQKVYPPTLAAWLYVSHREDLSIRHSTIFMGQTGLSITELTQTFMITLAALHCSEGKNGCRIFFSLIFSQLSIVCILH